MLTLEILLYYLYFYLNLEEIKVENDKTWHISKGGVAKLINHINLFRKKN